jgi:hypothetical protein
LTSPGNFHKFFHGRVVPVVLTEYLITTEDGLPSGIMSRAMEDKIVPMHDVTLPTIRSADGEVHPQALETWAIENEVRHG